MKRHSKALVLFAKQIIPGEVKTRLGREIGMQQAADLYRGLFQLSLQHCSSPDWQNIIYWNKEGDRPNFTMGYPSFQQAEGNLGIKMQEAFRTVLESFEKVVMIGTDCPGLRAHHIEKAFQQLDEHDLVLGPAEDGGYYLIGLAKLHSTLFQLDSWSHAEVFRQTMEIATEQNLSVALLEKLYDIDRPEDLSRWNASSNAG